MSEIVTNTNTNVYDKMPQYIESVFNVFILVNKRGEKQNDKRLKLISLVIFNYLRKLAADYNINLKEFKEPEFITLIPIFEYISYNNIELYDFDKIDVTQLDVSSDADLERFVLTHIYYITQAK